MALTSRSGRVSRPQSLAALATGNGLTMLVAGDASTAEAAVALGRVVGESRLPLGGIMHAAGIQVNIFQDCTVYKMRVVRAVKVSSYSGQDSFGGLCQEVVSHAHICL